MRTVSFCLRGGGRITWTGSGGRRGWRGGGKRELFLTESQLIGMGRRLPSTGADILCLLPYGSADLCYFQETAASISVKILTGDLYGFETR